MQAKASYTPQWHDVCHEDDLVTNSGVCALIGEEQVAIFRVSDHQGLHYFAISNWDPIGEANVLYRGIIGSLSSKLVVASPLYKEHYDLATGECIERDDVSVKSYPVRIEAQRVMIEI